MALLFLKSMTYMARYCFLGVGYDKNTSLHLADARASYPSKHDYIAHSAIKRNGKRVWKDYQTLFVDGEDFNIYLREVHHLYRWWMNRKRC